MGTFQKAVFGMAFTVWGKNVVLLHCFGGVAVYGCACVEDARELCNCISQPGFAPCVVFSGGHKGFSVVVFTFSSNDRYYRYIDKHVPFNVLV